MKLSGVEPKYTAPSVVKAFEILTFLSKTRNRNSTLTEITNGIDLNRSTCYRILQTLVNEKVLRYDEESKRFSLGTYLIVLGNRASESIDYMVIAKEYLTKISELTNSTCGLVQRIGDEWVYIEKEVSKSPYSLSINVGQRFPLNAGATAKLILSYLSAEERMEILDRIGLKKYTENTVLNTEEFLNELPTIKEQGYAISHNEHVEGVGGLSFPIENKLGQLEFVLTVIMITSDKKESDYKKMATEVKKLTDELSSLI